MKKLSILLAGIAAAATLGGFAAQPQPSKANPKDNAPAATRPARRPGNVQPATPGQPSTPATPAQPAEPAQPFDMGDPEQMMQMWRDMNKLNEEHERIAQLAGEWETEATMTMPGMPEPAVEKGKQVNTMMLDGRFLRMESKGEFMGTAMSGVGHFGFNTMAGQNESTWMDNIGTGIYFYTGKFDPAQEAWELKGTFSAMGMEMTQRLIITLPENDTYTMKFYETFPGQPEEANTMTIKYTRVGARKGAGR